MKSIIPEVVVYLKTLAIGFLMTMVFFVFYYVSSSLGAALAHSAPSWMVVVLCASSVVLICLYIFFREGVGEFIKIIRSYRFDLLIVLVSGGFFSILMHSEMGYFYDYLSLLSYFAAVLLWVLLSVFMIKAIVSDKDSSASGSNNGDIEKRYQFWSDSEILSAEEDALDVKQQAESYADLISKHDGQQPVVFGVDGEWGVGKTSFINMIQECLEREKSNVVVCRFEPLRHASEPMLVNRLVRELSASVQSKVFAPEFKSAVDRYSRYLKGDVRVSVLGFSSSLAQPEEKSEQLLEDIDHVMKRYGLRLFVVIDDLDRLTPSAVNNVLFATVKTFRLSRASYLLSYDTEMLLGQESTQRDAREFLEKFISVKLNMFVDPYRLKIALLKMFDKPEGSFSSEIHPQVLSRLKSIAQDVSEIINGQNSSDYLPVLGNLRKIKRFLNTLALLRLDDEILSKTDCCNQDLIHLVLIYLNYPGVFRNIFSDESGGRAGKFSLQKDLETGMYTNHCDFKKYLDAQPTGVRFLLEKLFDVKTLGMERLTFAKQEDYTSRACFNVSPQRNLEVYIDLIVKQQVPLPQETFKFYRDASKLVLDGEPIDKVLKDKHLSDCGDSSSQKFWRTLYTLSVEVTNPPVDAILTSIMRLLPSCSSVAPGVPDARTSMVLYVSMFLNIVPGLEFSDQDARSHYSRIAERIFGEGSHKDRALIDDFTTQRSLPLGWNDLMLFRLFCCLGRGSRSNFNIAEALILHQNPESSSRGDVVQKLQEEMRQLSQAIFAKFDNEFIQKDISFYKAVDDVEPSSFLGKMKGGEESDVLIRSARTSVKSFVIYQLARKFFVTTTEGMPCGVYDPSGENDDGGISERMNDYVFNVCFDPGRGDDNICSFIDHCLSHKAHSFFVNTSDIPKADYVFNKDSLLGGLDEKSLSRYWHDHKSEIERVANANADRVVHTVNYSTSYSEECDELFKMLDSI